MVLRVLLKKEKPKLQKYKEKSHTRIHKKYFALKKGNTKQKMCKLVYYPA